MEDGRNETVGTVQKCLIFKVEKCRKKDMTKNDKNMRQFWTVPTVSKRRKNNAKFKSNI